MAEDMAQKARANKSITTDLLAFIVADVADGAVLRRFDMDTPARRVTDGIVDHASVTRVAYEAWHKSPEARPYIGIPAARAIAVSGLNLAHYGSTGEVTKGRWNQKATNLATAAFVLSAISGDRRTTQVTGILASGIAIGTTLSHLKNLGKRHPTGIQEL